MALPRPLHEPDERLDTGRRPLDPAGHAHAHAHDELAPHGGRYDDILDAIGHTPLVEIPRMSPNPDVRIFAKLEMLNPTGSVKDRAAKYLIEDLEARGLKSDQIPMPAEAFEPEAKKRVTLGLIIAELVRRESLAAKPDQLKAVVQDYAQSYERPEEVVRWYYQSPERLREVESLVLENNVVDWVVSKVKVEDKPTDFDELMGGAK